MRGQATEINPVVRQFITDKGEKTIVYDNTDENDAPLRPASKPYREKNQVFFNMRDRAAVDDANVMFLKLSLNAARSLCRDLQEMDLDPRCPKCGVSSNSDDGDGGSE